MAKTLNIIQICEILDIWLGNIKWQAWQVFINDQLFSAIIIL